MPDLLETRDGGVAVLTLNRPERLNALSPAMLEALTEALERIGTDETVGCVVLTGAGRGFCAGGDVKAMAQSQDAGWEQRHAYLQKVHKVPRLLHTLPKVVIAAVNGPCFGAGFSLALACDLRIAGRSARFGTAFAKVGLAGDHGGSWTLTRLVGPARARELFLLAEELDAAAALAQGIVNRVCDDADLAEQALALARRLADGPRVALGYIKQNLLAAETESLQAVLDLEALHQAKAGFTEDHHEARQAFVEKRAPVFRGR